jgi:hypothetical protein
VSCEDHKQRFFFLPRSSLPPFFFLIPFLVLGAGFLAKKRFSWLAGQPIRLAGSGEPSNIEPSLYLFAFFFFILHLHAPQSPASKQ